MSETDRDDDVPEGTRCDECGDRARESRFNPGHFYLSHGGNCSRNSAFQVCDRCGFRHIDRDFGQVLSCIMEVPLSEGREMQRRIVERLES